MTQTQFDNLLKQIMSARYGEDVRQSIHDALQGMDEIVNTNTKDVATAVASANSAASAANDAAGKANTAASGADSAKTAANNAASAANTATTQANAARDAANTATTQANAARDAANTAASKATAEAGKATEAATQANTAASSANSAASAATEAAGKVDAAIESAEQKTDAAVKKAETAATQANTAKTEADKATTRANDAAAIIETLDLGDINTGEIATKNYVTERIDAVEIGGTNLLRGTNTLLNFVEMNGYELSGWVKSAYNVENIAATKVIDITDAPSLSITKGVQLENLPDKNAWNGISQNYFPFRNNVTYTLSCYARVVSGSSNLHVQMMYDSSDESGKSMSNKIYNLTNEWKKYVNVFTIPEKEHAVDYYTRASFFMADSSTQQKSIVQICGMKLELGNKATDWSPAPEGTKRAISRRSAVTYDYGGRNLKEIFGTAKALHDALAAEDYTNIAVGDYWPVTLNGTFWDYGAYHVSAGVMCYLDADLQQESHALNYGYECEYVSDKAAMVSKIGGVIDTRYVSISDCIDHQERTCTNVTVKLEIGSINHDWGIGINGGLSIRTPSIDFISRDCLPFYFRMNKGDTKWEDENATNPWIGSALYKTLNDLDHGFLKLLLETELGPYIYRGLNNNGATVLLERMTINDSTVTGWDWKDIGTLFLPSEVEVWGTSFRSDRSYTSGRPNQFAIFRDSSRHIVKGLGDGGGKVGWWTSSPAINNKNYFTYIDSSCFGSWFRASAGDAFSAPICFIFK